MEEAHLFELSKSDCPSCGADIIIPLLIKETKQLQTRECARKTVGCPKCKRIFPTKDLDKKFSFGWTCNSCCADNYAPRRQKIDKNRHLNFCPDSSLYCTECGTQHKTICDRIYSDELQVI